MSPGGDHLWMSRPLRAGAFTFFVGSTDAEIKDQVEGLFRDLPTAEASDGEVECFVLVGAGSASDDGRWDLTGPVVGERTSLTLASAATLLMVGVNLAALGAEPERLHLHAAAAVRDGRAVVLSAPRETGKTTTLAHLVLRGWEYVSDEAVSIGPDDDEVRGFGKPLSIKPGGRHLVPELEPHMIPPLSVAADDEVLHVSLGAIGATAVSGAEPSMVVLLRRPDELVAGTQASTSVVHAADAVVRVMGETMDAGRYGPNAVVELARLAARCRCHEVLIGEPESTVEVIEHLFAEDEVEPLQMRVLEDGASISPDVVSLMIGDRVVVHEQPEGKILALDPAASQIWLTLGGWPAAQEIDLSGPVVARFVEQLVALGLVLPGAGRSSPNGER